jgi:hypothetical protein
MIGMPEYDVVDTELNEETMLLGAMLLNPHDADEDLGMSLGT